MAFFKFGTLVERVTSTVTAGGTTTLLNNSQTYQQFTGSTTQTVVLPDATTCPVGMKFTLLNLSTGSLTVNFNGGSLAATMLATTQKTFRVTDNSTSAGTWDISVEASVSAGGSLSGADKLSASAALANQEYVDSQVETHRLAFNPEEVGGNFWLARPALAATTNQDPAPLTLGGYLYSCGGHITAGANLTTVTRYDDSNNYWLARTSMSNARYLAASWAISGFGFVVGGIQAGNNGVTFNERYTDSTDTWTSKASITTANGNQYAFQLGGTYGFSAGGTDGSATVLSTNQMYDATNDAWQLRQPLQTVQAFSEGTQLNDFGYAVAGQNASITIAIVQKFNYQTNTWKNVASTPAADARFGDTNNGTYIYKFGGNTDATATFEYVDFSDLWRSRASLSTSASNNYGGNLNGYAYSMGDASANGLFQRYVGTNYLKIPLQKRTSSVPTSIYIGVAIGDFTVNCPAQVRTDGDNWKTLTANSDTALRTGDTYSSKFIEYGLVYAGTGGTAANNSITSTEFYNPQANTWTNRANINVGRIFAAGFAIGGLGYVAGGSGATVATAPVNSVEKYNEIANTYSTLSSTLPVAKEDGASYNLKGLGYFVGGSTGATFTGNTVATNYSYNATTDIWSTKTAMTAARAGQGFTLLEHGYFAGGNDNAGTAQSTLYSYDPIPDSWATKSSLPSTTQSGQNSCFTQNAFGYSVGSTASTTAAYKYNQNSDAWTTVASTSANRVEGAGVQSGGIGYIISNGNAITSAEYYNDAANTWTTTAAMNTGREGAASSFTPGTYRNYELRVAVPNYIAGVGASVWVTQANTLPNSGTDNPGNCQVNGSIYSIGGRISTSDTNVTYKFSDVNKAYTQSFTLNNNRAEGACASGNGFIYLMHGGAQTTSAEKLNDLTGWTSITATSSNLRSASSASLNNFIYSCGGDPAGAVTGTVEQYTDPTNAWATKTSLTTARSRLGCWNQKGFMYVVSGDTNLAAEQYDDASNAWTTKATSNNNHSIPPMFTLLDQGYQCGGNGGNTTTEKYDDNTNLWIIMPSLPATTYGQNLGTSVNGSGYILGGGSGTYTQTYQYVPSQNSLVLGVALRVN